MIVPSFGEFGKKGQVFRGDCCGMLGEEGRIGEDGDCPLKVERNGVGHEPGDEFRAKEKEAEQEVRRMKMEEEEKAYGQPTGRPLLQRTA